MKWRLGCILLLIAWFGCGGVDPISIPVPDTEIPPEPEPGQSLEYVPVLPSTINTYVDPTILEDRMQAVPTKFLRELARPDRIEFALAEIESDPLINAVKDLTADWDSNDGENQVSHPAGDVLLAGYTPGPPYRKIEDVDEDSTPLELSIFPTSPTTHHDKVEIGSGNGSYVYYSHPGADDIKVDEYISNVIDTWAQANQDVIGGIDRLTLRITRQATLSARLRMGYRIDGVDYWRGPYSSGSWGQSSGFWGTNPKSGVDWIIDDFILGFGPNSIEKWLLESSTSSGGPGIGYISEFVIEIGNNTRYWGTGYIRHDIDVGTTVENEGTFTLAYTSPNANATLTVNILGSATGAFGGEEDDLGNFVDGDPVPAGYQHYRVQPNFATTGRWTATLDRWELSFPEVVYRFNSLDSDVLDSIPMLQGIPGRTIRLDPTDFVTEGSTMTLDIVDDGTVSEMLRTNYMSGLPARVRIGMYADDITNTDLAPYFRGKVTDFTYANGVASVRIKDLSKDLSVKLPLGSAPSTLTPLTYDQLHMVDVIEDIIRVKAGITSRWVNSDSLATLKANVGDGTPVAANFLVKRKDETGGGGDDTRIKDPVPAKSLVSELLELMGAFLLIQEDGRLSVVEYDTSIASVDTWTNIGAIKDTLPNSVIYTPAIEDTLTNVAYVFYDHNGGGTAYEDYLGIRVALDSTSQDNWRQTRERIIKTPWLSSDANYYGDDIASHIVAREVARLKDSMGRIDLKTNLDKLLVQVGDFVNLSLSEILRPGVAVGEVVKCFVVSKTWDVEGGEITWELVEAM